MQSEQINELAEALAKAQGAMAGAKKDEENPFYKKNYADLASVWNAAREPLSENGLSVIQNVRSDKDGNVFVVSMMMHKSGQWIDSRMPVKPVKNDMQGLGAAISYARRYLLSAQAGVYQVDIDADEDQGGGDKKGDEVIKTKIQTEKEKADLSEPIPPQDDIPIDPPRKGELITRVQATDFRKECSRLKIPTAKAKEMLKEHDIKTVDDIPARQFEHHFKGLEYLAQEIANNGKEVSA